MRELKFRVWDNTGKCWLDNYVIYQYGNVSSNGVWCGSSDVVIEQFSVNCLGLYDEKISSLLVVGNIHENQDLLNEISS